MTSIIFKQENIKYVFQIYHTYSLQRNIEMTNAYNLLLTNKLYK